MARRSKCVGVARLLLTPQFEPHPLSLAFLLEPSVEPGAYFHRTLGGIRHATTGRASTLLQLSHCTSRLAVSARRDSVPPRG